MTAVKEEANAKINLFLDVLSKREDGFHEIRTVMHSVSLSDEITVTFSPSDKRSVRLKVMGSPYLPTDSRNLAVAAANAYMDACAIAGTVDITLKKKIPIAAGLAGGSTDAAAVLRAMNRINKRCLTERIMQRIAASLGSDVPYCYIGKTALCLGRGDDITRLNSKISAHFAIAIGNERVSTPTAYGALDAKYSNFDGSVKTAGEKLFDVAMRDIENGNMPSKSVFNVFESVVLPLCPLAEGAKKYLTELGADVAMMSGSGPSVFGVFSDEGKARLAVKALEEKGYNAFYAHSV